MEFVYQAARCAQPRQGYDGGSPETKTRVARQGEKINSTRRNIFAEIARTQGNAVFSKFVKELGLEQMHLTQIGQRGASSRKIAMLNG